MHGGMVSRYYQRCSLGSGHVPHVYLALLAATLQLSPIGRKKQCSNAITHAA
jgi:hypothetical protein